MTRSLPVTTIRLLCVFVLASATTVAQVPEYALPILPPATTQRLVQSGIDIAGCASELRAFPVSSSQEQLLLSLVPNAQQLTSDISEFYVDRALQEGQRDGVGFGNGSVGGHWTEAQLIAFMDNLVQQFPTLIAPKVSIGTSYEGRHIWMWKLSDNPGQDEAEPEILIDGLHHAREPMSMAEVAYVAFRLCAAYGNDPDLSRLVDERELYLVPIVNPDGYVYNTSTHPLGGGLWRKNRRLNADGSFGVDPNRNYDWAWGTTGTSPVMSDDTYPGTNPFSEPCTIALKTFAESRNLTLTLSLHAFGNAVLIPPSHSFTAFPSTTLRTQYERVSDALSALPAQWAADYPWRALGYLASGTAMDWCYGELYGGEQTWAFGMEIGSSADGFWPAPSRILPLCEEAFSYVSTILKSAAGYPIISQLHTREISGGVVDQVWQPGEVIEVTASLMNGGLEDGLLSMSLSSSSPWVQPLQTNSVIGTLGPGGSIETTSGPLSFRIDPATPPGVTISIQVTANMPFGGIASRRHRQPIGLGALTLINEHFEGSASTWTVGALGDTATAGHWVKDAPQATLFVGRTFNPGNDHTTAPGSQCWFTQQGTPGALPSASDVDGITTLVSPTYDLSHIQSPNIEYWRWFITSEKDVLYIEVSNDGGLSWRELETLKGRQNFWRLSSFRLEDFIPVTSQMRFRFRAEDLPLASLCEAAIDDFKITGFSPAMDLNVAGAATWGSSVALQISAPLHANSSYLLGAALDAQVGIPSPIGTVPLDADDLFSLVLVTPSVFSGFAGLIDAQGFATATINLPPLPGPFTLRVVVAGVIGDSQGLNAHSGGLRFVIQ